VTAYISGAAYVVVGYTIRLVVYCVVYAAVYVFIVGLVLDDRSERLFKRESMPEQRDDTFPHLVPERVNQ
jgi:hypothetical protein